MERDSHAGTVGWAALALGVLVFDTLAPETLTHAFERGMANPYSRPVVLGALGVTALHLLDRIPNQLDPFDRLLGAVKREG